MGAAGAWKHCKSKRSFRGLNIEENLNTRAGKCWPCHPSAAFHRGTRARRLLPRDAPRRCWVPAPTTGLLISRFLSTVTPCKVGSPPSFSRGYGCTWDNLAGLSVLKAMSAGCQSTSQPSVPGASGLHANAVPVPPRLQPGTLQLPSGVQEDQTLTVQLTQTFPARSYSASHWNATAPLRLPFGEWGFDGAAVVELLVSYREVSPAQGFFNQDITLARAKAFRHISCVVWLGVSASNGPFSCLLIPLHK